MGDRKLCGSIELLRRYSGYARCRQRQTCPRLALRYHRQRHPLCTSHCYEGCIQYHDRRMSLAVQVVVVQATKACWRSRCSGRSKSRSLGRLSPLQLSTDMVPRIPRQLCLSRRIHLGAHITDQCPSQALRHQCYGRSFCEHASL